MSSSPDDRGAPISPVLTMAFSLSRPVVLPGRSENEPLFALLRIGTHDGSASRASATVNGAVPHEPSALRAPGDGRRRSAFHLVLLLDASGSMHRITLDGPEREYWQRLGAERGELKRGRVDGRHGWLWSGQTLAELHAQHRTPMEAALCALRQAAERLGTSDRLTVIAFADRAGLLLSADAADRLTQIHRAMARLSSGVEESGLGDGTRLAEALRLALEEIDSERSADPDLRRVVPIPRLILISDGLIEDRTAAGAGVERLAEAGVALSCIGVGDQFDEEWLMWASDMTRGRFRYAPSADALETILAGEIDRLEQTVARRLSLRLRPLSGALLRDLYQVSPDLSPLQRLETDGFDRSYCLGDLGRDQEAMFLAELSLPVLAAGQRPVLAAELTAAGPEGEPLSSVETEAIIQAATDLGSEAIDPADLEAVAAVHAHRTERKAQRALRSGRIREATRHLRDTRQIAERFGRLELAADLEAEAAALENGTTVSADLAKRVKAETRRLMGA